MFVSGWSHTQKYEHEFMITPMLDTFHNHSRMQLVTYQLHLDAVNTRLIKRTARFVQH